MQNGWAMDVAGGHVSDTQAVWDILMASHRGDLEAVQAAGPGLMYAQYNYTPPIHFAVREGHTGLVRYLLGEGAYDPTHITYPFKESLLTVAEDRGHDEIAALLRAYETPRYTGDNGRIHYPRTETAVVFEKAVNKNDLATARHLLSEHPEYAKDETFFWGEGILTRPVKDGYYEMIDLLLEHGASVPGILKWVQFYYFETYAHAKYIMERGMNPNVKSWHGVTVLHDMAQKGHLDKAALLLDHGAFIDPLEEEYQSTPLGMAARWGHVEMVRLLLDRGADRSLAGASWATPKKWAQSKGHKAIENMLSS